MIYMYTGTPGSGKSFHLATRIYDWLRYTDVRVIANFPVDTERVYLTFVGYVKSRLNSIFHIPFEKYNSKKDKNNFQFVETSKLSVDFLVEYALKNHRYRNVLIAGKSEKCYYENQTTIVIDEAQVLFNCRGWQTTERQKWCEFFRQHRHLGYNVIMSTQAEKLIDTQIRCLTEIYVIHRNLKYFNWFAKLLSLLGGGSVFVCLYQWQGCRDVYKREMCRYRTRIANIYNSYSMISAGSAPNVPRNKAGATHSRAVNGKGA